MKFHIAVLALTSLSSYAGSVKREKPLVQVYKNSDCLKTDSCDLKEFKLETYNYNSIIAGDATLGSSATMSYKTDKVENLEKYAVVQFIKGCVYNSKLVDGKIEKNSYVSRDFFGEIKKFTHPQWVIDSVDKDPVYNSIEKLRHGAYRWNTVAGSTEKKTQKYYLNEKPTRPELYVTDLPSTAFFMYGEAKNVSLEFKACIYKTSDVPMETDPEDTTFAEPIKCFDWKSSFIYNHTGKLYESKKEIDSYCLQ